MFTYNDAVSEISASHYGFVSAELLRDAGLPRSVRKSAARRGWRQIQRGLWFVDGPDLTFDNWIQAGLMVGGPESAVGGAASLFIRKVITRQPEHVDIWVPPHRNPSPVKDSPLRFHRDHGGRLLRRDSAGPLISMSEAVLDFISTEQDTFAAASAIINARRLSHRFVELVQEAVVLRRRQGHRKLLEELITCFPAYDSVLEYMWVVNIERRHGIRPSTRQWVSPDNNRHDGVWQDLQTIYELDGDAYHNNATTRKRDSDKDYQARSRGFQILRYQYLDVAHHFCQTTARLIESVPGLTARPCSTECWVNKQ